MDFIPVYQDVLVGMRPLDIGVALAYGKKLRLIIMTSVTGIRDVNSRSPDSLEMTWLTGEIVRWLA